MTFRDFIPDQTNRLQAVQTRHGDVEQHHFGLELARQLLGLHPVASLANHDDIALSVEHQPQALPNQYVIVSDQNSNSVHIAPRSTIAYFL
jgi:hypothetical protein